MRKRRSGHAGVSGKRGLLHLRSYDVLYVGGTQFRLRALKNNLTSAMRSIFFIYPHTIQCASTLSVYAAVHSSAYRHSKTTLRARCALFFHIRTSSSLQALCLYANMKKQPHGFRKVAFSLVPAVGLEPTRMISPQDFESSASASFTTPAQE